MIIVDRRPQNEELLLTISKVKRREDFGEAFMTIFLEEGYFIELEKAEIEQIIKEWKK